MHKFLLSLFVLLLGLGFSAVDVQAKRLGGGGSSGMQRQMPSRAAPTSPPAQQAPGAAPATPGATPAAAPGRSWMGPLAGLAAGLGLAALMSHLGFGAEFGNFLMLALLAMGAFIVVRSLLRRLGPATPGDGLARKDLQFAGAGPVAGTLASPPSGPSSGVGSPAGRGTMEPYLGAAPVESAAAALPPGFDKDAFERIAKLIFIRMQAANDKADLEDLRQFATPEMFAVFKLDLQDRRNAPQQTDVVQLAAEVLDFAQEGPRQIVSVRFHGLIREEKDAPAAAFDEIWHLVKPTDGSREWAIAGIAQRS